MGSSPTFRTKLCRDSLFSVDRDSAEGSESGSDHLIPNLFSLDCRVVRFRPAGLLRQAVR
jgi:hypothetical protein